MPYLMELIGRLFCVPLHLFLATIIPFMGFHFNDRADWTPLILVFCSFQLLVICRLRQRQWPAAGRLAFAFTLAVACLAPVFMYFAGWYWCYGDNGASPTTLPHAAQFVLNLLTSGDRHLMNRHDIGGYCCGWIGWIVNTGLQFFILNGKQMTKRQRIGALLLFLMPWVAYELFTPFPVAYWFF